MGENNLSVKITADITDLVVKSTLAKAEISAMAAEMRKLGAATTAGMGTSETAARMQQLAGDLVHARSEASVLAGSLERAGVSVSSFGARAGETHLALGMATREVRALSTELSRGEFGMAPITLARLAHSLLGVGPGALIAIAGIGGLVAGLGYLIAKSIATSNALDRMAIGAAFSGNVDLTRAKLKELTDVMTETAGISEKDALAIANAIARIPDMSAPAAKALASQMGAMEATTGETAAQISQKVARMFDPGESAEKMVRSFAGVTQAQIDAAKAADQSGNSQLVVAAKLDVLGQSLARASGQIAEHNAGIVSSVRNWLAYSLAVGESMTKEDVHAALLDQENAKQAEQNRLLQQNIALIRATPPPPDQTLKTGVAVAEKENPVVKQVQDAKVEIDKMTAALNLAQATGDKVNVDLLTASIAKAREQMTALQFGPRVEQMREQMGEVAASWDGTQSGMLERQRAIAQKALGEVRSQGKERLAIEQEISRLTVQIRQAEFNEIMANARTTNAEIAGETNLSATQRLARERDTWQQILATDKLTETERVSVQREYNGAVAALERARQSEQRAIARSDVDTEIAISRLTIEAKKSLLDTDLAAHKINAAQKLSILKDLTTQEETLDEAALNAQLATLQQGTAEYEQTYNKIRELRAKLNVDIAAADRQYESETARAAQQQVTQWQKAVGEIGNAESTMLSDLLSMRKRFGQAALQVTAQLAQQEIANDRRAITTRLLMSQSEQATEKALQLGGFLYHLFFQGKKTQATVESETSQTAATVFGNHARTDAAATAQAVAREQSIQEGVAQIGTDAAVAAAGAAASVSMIPYVGWAMAPQVAAQTYSTTMGWADLASLDVGAWNVPRDMTARIHAGETVMPRDFASGFRAAAGADARSGATNAGGGSAGAGGETHFNVGLSAVDHRGLSSYLRSPQGRKEMTEALHQAYRRGVKGTRR